MKLSTAYRKSKAHRQSWNRHIDAFHQKLANKRIRQDERKIIEEESHAVS